MEKQYTLTLKINNKMAFRLYTEVDIDNISVDIADKIKEEFITLAENDEFPLDLSDGALYDRVATIIYDNLVKDLV